MADEESRGHKLAELALVFLRLGSIAIGGPGGQIAMLRQEVVERRRWMTDEEFLDRVGAANLIPGPSSTEVTIFTGFYRAGLAGLVVAGASYMMPAVAIVAAIAWVYVHYGNLPQVAGLLYGVKPAVIVLVVDAVWKLGRASARTLFLAVLGLAAAGSAVAGAGPLAVIAGAGAVAGFGEWGKRTNRGIAAAIVLSCVGAIAIVSQVMGPVAAGEPGGTIGLHNVFLYFLRTGSVIYGGGFVLMAFLQKDLVAVLHWVTSKQLLDAIAIGQVTPGPVFTTATFIGYILLGMPGALVATLGIFLPSFLFCALSGPLIPILRKSCVASEFLNGVNVASVALMAVVSWDLARAALVDPLSIGMAAACIFLLALTKVRFGWLLLACGLIGIFAR